MFLAGVAVAICAAALGMAPDVVERLYAPWFGPEMARRLSLLTGWIPISVGALLAVATVGAGTVRVALGIRRLREGRPLRLVARDGANELGGALGVFLVLFYPLWGLNYARAPLDERLGLRTEAPADQNALRSFAAVAAEATNAAYRSLHGGASDIGRPTEQARDAATLSGHLEVGWGRLVESLSLSEAAGKRYGPAKERGATWLLESLDIAGIYVPFTGEATVNGAQPDLSLPAVVGHEQAHQRGIARENEASFAGMLAAIHSEDPLARYSGWARILRSLHYDLSVVDRDGAREIARSLHQGVRRDWEAYAEWLRASASAAAPVVSATNDVYLRTHGVPDGVENYGRVSTLLLEWARRHDGFLAR